MTFVASLRIRCVGCVYAGRCVYAPDAAFTHTCLYAGVGAYTRVRAYTNGVYAHPRVRIHRWVCIRRQGCVYAGGAGRGAYTRGRCEYASAGCVYAAGVYTHPGAYTQVGAYTRAVVCIHSGCEYVLYPLAYTQVSAYTHPRPRKRRKRQTVMQDCSPPFRPRVAWPGETSRTHLGGKIRICV